MPRVKRGTLANKKREKLLRSTKGFRWDRKSKERAAKEALLHAWSRSFKGRKEKKRTNRTTWNVKVNAGAREEGITYSKFINLLKKKGVIINRKMLSELANTDPATFKKIVEFVSK